MYLYAYGIDGDKVVMLEDDSNFGLIVESHYIPIGIPVNIHNIIEDDNGRLLFEYCEIVNAETGYAL